MESWLSLPICRIRGLLCGLHSIGHSRPLHWVLLLFQEHFLEEVASLSSYSSLARAQINWVALSDTITNASTKGCPAFKEKGHIARGWHVESLWCHVELEKNISWFKLRAGRLALVYFRPQIQQHRVLLRGDRLHGST